MAALLDQLRQLHTDLNRLAGRDPEQEVTGLAFNLLDAVISEARRMLPEGSTLQDQVIELINADLFDDDESEPKIRAADAVIIVGQLLAVYESAERQKPNASVVSPARMVRKGRSR